MDRIRDAIETSRSQFGGQGGNLAAEAEAACSAVAASAGSAASGAAFGGRGGRGNFRGFNPGQPHGAIFWIGSNSALNAEPFAFAASPQQQPAIRHQPLRPHLHERARTFRTSPSPAARTPSSSRSPARAVRTRWTITQPCQPTPRKAGDFSAAGLPPIYDPATFQQFISNGTPNVIPLHAHRLAGQLRCSNSSPSPIFAGTRAELPSAHHRAVELDAGRRALYAQPRSQRNCPSAGGRGGGGGGAEHSRIRACARASTSITTGADSASDNVNIFPRTGRQKRFHFQLRAGRLHGRLSQSHQHLQRQLESQQQPDDQFLHQRI